MIGKKYLYINIDYIYKLRYVGYEGKNGEGKDKQVDDRETEKHGNKQDCQQTNNQINQQESKQENQLAKTE